MKKVYVLLVAIAMIFSLVACSGNNLVGSWEVEGNEELIALGLDLTITFTEEEMAMLDVSFPYRVEKDQLIIDMMGQEEIMTFNVDGDILTLSLDGEDQIFNRVKE